MITSEKNLKFALIGKGISYSHSPMLHKMFFSKHEVNCAAYKIEDIENLSNSINFLKDNYNGFNVTKPYKIEIMDYLDKIDDEAKIIGSVNTVTNENGKLTGYNTDIDGIIDTFNFDNIDVKNKNCLVLGYGGVAKTLIYALYKMGAKSISVAGRNIDKIEEFIAKASQIGIDVSISDVMINDDYSLSEIDKYQILINATTVGTASKHKTPIDVSLFSGLEYVFDLIYNPRETALIKKARSLGIKARDGLYMLVSQAGNAQRYYLDIPLKNDEIFDIYTLLAGEIFKNSIKERNFDNIVFVGFMGSGKSSVGKKLAKILSLPYVDTDSVIEDKYGSITSIFEKYGEEYFRDIENKVLVESLTKNAIISTGGGIVMRDKNIDELAKSNSLIIYLDTSFETLKDRAFKTSRPLFKVESKAYELFKFRCPKYEKIASITINGDKSIDEVIDDILKF